MAPTRALICALLSVLALGAVPAWAEVTELQPTVAIPASCHASPVYGSLSAPPSPPFLLPQPTFSGIRMNAYFTRGSTIDRYNPARAQGTYFLFNGTQGSIQVAGSNGTARIKQLFPLGIDALLRFPKPGCWRLHLESGDRAAQVTLWVAGAK